jgi:hypothetical protein
MDVLKQAEKYGLTVVDGKIHASTVKVLHYPYVFSNQSTGRDCTFKHHILFDIIFEQGMVPSKCFDCWKVVASPRTYEELMALYHFQRKCGKPSKCGIEGDRGMSHRLYAGYFYNDSYFEGIECWHLVSRALNMPVILKRGCTEFEMACGPSDRWVVKPGQLEIEQEADRLFVRDGKKMFMQSPYERAEILKEWVRCAHRWGDMTYLKTNERIMPSVVTYNP